jgi:hypothetical protein
MVVSLVAPREAIDGSETSSIMASERSLCAVDTAVVAMQLPFATEFLIAIFVGTFEDSLSFYAKAYCFGASDQAIGCGRCKEAVESLSKRSCSDGRRDGNLFRSFQRWFEIVKHLGRCLMIKCKLETEIGQCHTWLEPVVQIDVRNCTKLVNVDLFGREH